MRNFILLVIAVFGIYQFQHWNDAGDSTPTTSSSTTVATSAEEMRIAMEQKQNMLNQIRAHTAAIRANPPMCGGRPMIYRESPENQQLEANLEREIEVLRGRILGANR